MPDRILFVQGAGEGTHDDWDARLVESLRRHLGGEGVRYPRMPDEDSAPYPAWKAVLLAEMAGLADGAVLVGHSSGGTILAHVLAEERPALRPVALILVAAPFCGEGGWPVEDLPDRHDWTGRLPGDMAVLLHHGAADDTVPAAHARLWAAAIPQAVLRILPGRDHQMNDNLREVAQDILALPARR